jgi:outer membrane protein OmpA-like peptidoglycan-associated protein
MTKSALIVMLLWANTGFSDEVTIKNNQLQLMQPLVFEAQNDVLHLQSQGVIADVKAFLDKKSYISTLRIEGNVNGFADEQQNLVLSAERGLAVAKALIAAGVACERLLVSALGSSKPVATNDTPEGRMANNRIDLVVAALRGHAIGGMPLEGVGQKVSLGCKEE